MLVSRAELCEILNVKERYLSPCNFHHAQNGAKEKGYNLISMTGRGKKAVYEIEPSAPSLPGEIWKSFPPHPDYQISNLGRVKHPKGGILEGTNSYGYLRYRISEMGQMPGHRLVMLTFSPIKNPELYCVDHINGIRNDNRLENLRWVF